MKHKCPLIAPRFSQSVLAKMRNRLRLVQVGAIASSVFFGGSNMSFALTLGLVAPQSGQFSALGAQMRAGAMLAAKDNNINLVVVDESCASNSGGEIADRLVSAKVDAAFGFLCSETLEAALPKLGASQIPVLTLSVRWATIMDDALKNNWPFYRLAPSTAAESQKLMDVILTQWAGSAFALIDDGTIRGRDLTEALRGPLEERGLKASFVDTYRPNQENQIALVRRLKKTGVTNVFVGGDRADIAIIARDALSENINLNILGGDAMRAPNQPPLADGVQAVTLPDYADIAANRDLIARLRQSGADGEGYSLPAYAAVTFLQNAAKADSSNLPKAIAQTVAQTPIGAIAFGTNHELKQNPYQLQEWRNGHFQPAQSGEMP